VNIACRAGEQEKWKAKASYLEIFQMENTFFMQNSISIETCDKITKGDKTLSYQI